MEDKQNRIYRSDAERFEQLVGNILRRFEFQVREGGDREQVDFTIEYAQYLVAIEVKYFRTVSAIKSIINEAAGRLRAVTVNRQYHGAILVVSSIVDAAYIDALATRYGVYVVDALALRNWVERFPDLAGQLEQLLPVLRDLPTAPEDEPQRRQKLSAPLMESVLSLATISLGLPPPPPPRTTGRDLCRELHALAKGKPTASKFEDLGARIFEYLFQEGLDWSTHRTQNRNADGLHIFDMICRVRGGTAFWDFVLKECRTRYMVFELKNYTSKIGQNQVYSTEKYLFREAFRSVAIIFSRLGPSNNAVEASRGAMRDAEKLLIHVSDADICKMLDIRDADGDPADYLFALVDEFLMELGR